MSHDVGFRTNMSQDSHDQRLTRVSVPELDAILGVQFPVLDSGFIRVVDYMGSDAAIVQAARVSYGTGTKRAQEDAALIGYLLRHLHTTPFEMCEIKFHVRVPMDCWRQWIRHRMASVNEYSTRYSVAIDAAQRTPATDWRLQSGTSKQGSDGLLPNDVGTGLSERETELLNLSRQVYQERLESGVAREQARKDLPLSTYTEAYWKIDLHNLFHFLRLRMAPEAQAEIRECASVIGREIVARWCPVAWGAFEEHQLNAVRFSAFEQLLVQALIAGNTERVRELALQRGWLTPDGQPVVRNRERREFETKLHEGAFALPWVSERA